MQKYEKNRYFCENVVNLSNFASTMNVEELRAYCLGLHGAEENAPWSVPRYSMMVTYSIGGKWFCIADLDKKFINIKCEPERVVCMQEHYEGAFPAWHMNKRHWLSIRLESDVPDALICELLSGAYVLVLNALPKRVRAAVLL